MQKRAVFFATCFCLAGCSVRSELPLGRPYAAVPAEPADPVPGEYLIGPLDTLNIMVFREPQLSVPTAQVDAGGEIVLPLIGMVKASGKSAGDLSNQLQTSLRRYLLNPRVAVAVNSISQTIAVEGAVNQPGIYPIAGKSSLIEALALARSPTHVAANDQVVVFRRINGQRVGARFDIRRIRMGLDPDPAILPGDRVVVGFHGLKEAWREYLAAPIFNVFRVIY